MSDPRSKAPGLDWTLDGVDEGDLVAPAAPEVDDEDPFAHLSRPSAAPAGPPSHEAFFYRPDAVQGHGSNVWDTFEAPATQEYEPEPDDDDELVDLDSLANVATGIRTKRTRRKRWLWIALVALVAVGAFVVAAVVIPRGEAPVAEADWFTPVGTVPAAGPAPAFTTSKPDWSFDAGDDQVIALSAGLLRLHGADLSFVDPKDGTSVLAKLKLTAPVDYTLEARSVNGPVIGVVSSDKLYAFDPATTKVVSWKLPANAQVSSNANSAFLVRDGDKVLAAVPGKSELTPVTAPEDRSVTTTITASGRAVSVSKTRARVLLASLDGKDIQAQDLPKPFEAAALYSTVHADEQVAAVLWKMPQSENTYTLSTYQVAGGNLIASVPVDSAKAAKTAWKTGQGGVLATYGRYTFDAAQGTAKSKLGAQEYVGGANGPLIWATSGSGLILSGHIDDKEEGATWESTPLILGVTSAGQLVTRDQETDRIQARALPVG